MIEPKQYFAVMVILLHRRSGPPPLSQGRSYEACSVQTTRLLRASDARGPSELVVT